jgi:hypothetical protein
LNCDGFCHGFISTERITIYPNRSEAGTEG